MKMTAKKTSVTTSRAQSPGTFFAKAGAGRFFAPPVQARLTSGQFGGHHEREAEIFFNQGRYNPASTEGRLLLAHELTHTIQQGASRPLPARTELTLADAAANIADDMRLRRNERRKRSGIDNREALPGAGRTPPELKGTPAAGPRPAAGRAQGAPAPLAERTAGPAKDKAAVPSDMAAPEAAVPKAPTSPKEDKDFQTAKGRVKKSARQQKSHETKELKRAETEAASALDADSQKEQDAKTKRTGELETTGETQQKTYKFDAETFKGLLLDKIRQILPQDEDQAKAFPKSNKLADVKSSVSDTVAQEKQNAVGPVDQKMTAQLPAGQLEKPDNVPIPPAKPAAAVPKIDPKLAAPKPKTDQEISLQHESDKLDDQMTENRLTKDQLANSKEPKFIQALDFKEKTQQRIAETPGEYRQQEQTVLAEAQQQTGQALQTDLGAMKKSKNSAVGKVFSSQGKTETKTEKRQREIKGKIDGIYELTLTDVEKILKNLTETVQSGFSKKLEGMTAIFNEYVTKRLKEYYGDWRIDDELFGPVAIVEDPETGKVMFINPEVWLIFKEEKEWYLKAMGRVLDDTPKTVSEGLTEAWERIQKGRREQDDFKKTLKGEELEYADTLTQEVNLKYEALESSIEETQNQLLESLSEQYAESVKQLEKTFNEINDELKKSWLTRAAEFIKAVAKTIFELAELLLSILIRLASLIWDIVKHPIRFFETLVKGLIKGIGIFIDDIGRYLEEAFWSWITGASAAKSIQLGPGSGVEKLFGLVVQVLSLSKEDLKKIAEKVFGKEIVALVEKGLAISERVTPEAYKLLEPATILMRDGLGAFWRYIKDTLASMVQGVITKIKETVFFEFVTRGLKWMAGFFIPGGGFVKVVKALLAAVQFLVNNMDRIRLIFDSILDSFEKAVKGDEGGVAAKVLIGIKTGIVLALDFLARVLGLDKILDKVQQFFKSLRKPILQAIEFVLRKVKTALEKIGFFRLVKKVGEAAKKGKEAVVKKAKQVKQKILNWWKARKRFRGSDGETHELYFKGATANADLMVASGARTVASFLKDIKKVIDAMPDEDAKKAQAGKAWKDAEAVDQHIQKLQPQLAKDNAAQKATERPVQAFQDRFNDLKGEMEKLAGLLGQLMELSGYKQKLPPPPILPPFSNNVRGQSLEAQYLSGDNKVPPGEASVEHEGRLGAWADLMEEGTRERDNFVRMHLLHHKMGGRATDSNLTPAKSVINSDFYQRLEQPALSDSGLLTGRKSTPTKPNKVIWYSVKLSYHSGDDFSQNFINSIKVQYGYHDQNKNWQKGPAQGTWSATPGVPDHATKKYVINEDGKTALRQMKYQKKAFKEDLVQLVVLERNESLTKKTKELYPDRDSMQVRLIQRIKQEKWSSTLPAEVVRLHKALEKPFKANILLHGTDA